mmetsp:Transcript_18625/g.56687  ORF Transcript_18625/g.56687 Transcript_18625/m.56687 type:complete len:188 (+) Transcript_18625:3-566(+)
MGSFLGRSLKSPVHHQKLDEMRPPVHFCFAFAKEDITHQKVEHMKEVHMKTLSWVGKFCTEIIESVEGLFQAVAEDQLMCGSLESVMPRPPPVSHLYLKHCKGREIAEDAATPRSEEASDSDLEAAMEPVSPLTPLLNGGGNMSSTASVMAGEIRASYGTKRKKIERNSVLTQQAKAGREARLSKLA